MKHLCFRLVVGALLGTVGLAATAQSAGAAAGPQTPGVLCGPGFRVVDSDPIRRTDTGQVIGKVHLLFDEVTGQACGVTVKSAYLGAVTRAGVYLSPEGAQSVASDGPRLVYAGPVRAPARGRCVLWGGLLADPAGTVFLHERANAAVGGIVTCF
ncbi:hypothetical protein ACFFMN_28745 [Planobispora siamensis]|uniref:Uncharacterized protein n=1 Tax=Planobispora siamensis TaxID=936338 RepID=A0A8J3WPY0_9ACTN|nr:hypothetical protein [Planobispora siamensis]GIH97445.1 hypothetical protein Psi01_80750 [Planobispora siamensis]